MHHRHLLAAGLLSLAALSSAQATNVTVLAGSGWKEFTVVDPAYSLGNTDFSWLDFNDYSNISFSFTVAAGQIGLFTVVDAGFAGDRFTINMTGVDANGVAFSATGTTGAAVNTYPDGVFDYDAALADARFSKGQISFNPGTYTITGSLAFSALDDTGAPLNSTLGAVRLDIAAVPEASTLAMLMAGLGVVGLLARRRAV
jgi:hypothetical protein